MQVTTEKYDPVKLENLKHFLEVVAKKGNARFYEIYVDGLKVVDRTNDPAEFSTHEEFVQDATKEVRVLVYSQSPLSPRVISKNIFRMQWEEPKKTETLDGVDVDARINERVALERERWETEQLKKELTHTQSKLSEAEDYIDTLHGKLEEADKNKQQKESLGELTGIFKEVLPGLVSDKKTDGQLAGSGEKKSEGDASFKKKGGSGETSITQEEREYMQIIRQMEEAFEEDELPKVMDIIRHLSVNASDIVPVAELLNISNNPKTENA